jgi:AAA domain
MAKATAADIDAWIAPQERDRERPDHANGARTDRVPAKAGMRRSDNDVQLRRARAAESAAARFKLVPFDSLTIGADPDYLVKGLIPRVGLVVIWGPPKCGKSFWAFDLFMHVALGRDYRGRKVQQGPVVYCAFEGQEGYGKRAEAFRQQSLADHAGPVAFYLMPVRMSLFRDHREFIAAIRQQLGDVKPAAIVLDTLNRSIEGSESADDDMGKYIQGADAVRESFNCVVPIIHHCGVEGTRPRGHTSLTGAVDAQLAVKRDGADNVVVTVEFMKDGPEGEQIVSRLEQLEVGRDNDGDPVTSCVVIPVEGAAVRSTINRKLSDRQRLALDALTNVAGERGAEPPARYGLPPGLCAIKIDDWRAELFARDVLNQDAKNPRTEFRRIKDSLKVRELIGERDGLVWSATAG